MLPEEISIYKRIELMQEYVHNECEAYVYNPNDKNYQIFLRIKHLVDNLSQSAFILLKQQKTLFRGNAAKISLQDIEQLIKKFSKPKHKKNANKNKMIIRFIILFINNSTI